VRGIQLHRSRRRGQTGDTETEGESDSGFFAIVPRPLSVGESELMLFTQLRHRRPKELHR
jgi:hypothetical protein